LVEVPEPRPGAGEVLVAISATALNRADLLQMQGLYPPPAGESEVPGLECAGTVVELGAGVASLRLGDRVMALLAGGGHAERVAVPEGQALRVPDGLSFNDAAAVPEAGVTAWTNLVYEGGLARGQTVLITAAASGVGTFAAQVAKELGARVVVAGRERSRLERLRPYGSDAEVELGASLPAAVHAVNQGEGVDLVLELAGGEGIAHSLAALRERGRLVLVGVLAGTRAEIDLGALLRRRLHLVGSVLRGRSRDEKAGLVQSFGEFALARLAEGRLRPVVDRVLPLERIAEAYLALQKGGIFGKIVVQVSE
jgi:putative PIG3 family NAD(P)H quinone oxidoreductase